MATSTTEKTVEPPKLKVCRARRFDGTSRVLCDTPYLDKECPKAHEHLMKIKSGFCNNGFCEGKKPKSFRGTPQKTCEFYTSCACDCHDLIDKMFKLIGEQRVLIENSEYVPDLIHFDINDYLPAYQTVPVGPDGVPMPNGLEGAPLGPVLPAPDVLATRRTETGRAARGGLEAQVWEVCVMFNDKGMAGLVTPRILADVIADKFKVPTPSTGAIGAVFDRWQALEFAKQAKKPVRFMGFVGEGTWEELLRLKGRNKREKKAEKAARFRRTPG